MKLCKDCQHHGGNWRDYGQGECRRPPVRYEEANVVTGERNPLYRNCYTERDSLFGCGPWARCFSPFSGEASHG